MANTGISKHARQAARQAAAAAAEELAARQRANFESLSTFFDAHERAEGVEQWLAERQAQLQTQAAERRSGFVRDGGLALRSMRDRGETLREIAVMTGLTEKAVREAIRAAEAIGEAVENNGEAATAASADGVPEAASKPAPAETQQAPPPAAATGAASRPENAGVDAGAAERPGAVLADSR